MRRHVLVALVAPGLGCGLVFDWNPQPGELTTTASTTMGMTETSEPTSEGGETQTTASSQNETTTEPQDTTSTSETTVPGETSETSAPQTDTSTSTGEPLCPNGTCDDGEDNMNCPGDCPPVCPNGVMEPGEECDDGNDIDTDECVEGCKNATCGDGFVLSGVEECDDDNDIDGDGCHNDCSLPRRRVFVTSTAYNGNLGGLVGADVKCNTAATALNPPGVFKAWLSDGVSGPVDWIDMGFNGYYVLPDKTTKVALGWQGLMGVLMHAIDQDEMKNEGVDSSVWTNVLQNGMPDEASTHCMKWLSGSSMNNNKGPFGFTVETGVLWTQAGEAACNSPYRLYCVEDPV